MFQVVDSGFSGVAGGCVMVLLAIGSGMADVARLLPSANPYPLHGLAAPESDLHSYVGNVTAVRAGRQGESRQKSGFPLLWWFPSRRQAEDKGSGIMDIYLLVLEG